MYIYLYSGTSSNQDTNGAERSVIVCEVSSFQRLKCMQEWYILGVGKGVLFREVSSVQECPHRERFHYIKYTDVPLYCYNIYQALQ